MVKIKIDWDILDDLIDKGFNCKQIAQYYGFANSKYFGRLAKKAKKDYLSVYIAKRRGKYYGGSSENNSYK